MISVPFSSGTITFGLLRYDLTRLYTKNPLSGSPTYLNAHTPDNGLLTRIERILSAESLCFSGVTLRFEPIWHIQPLAIKPVLLSLLGW